MLLEMLSVPFDKAFLEMAPEIGHLSPVILTMGSLFMSISTLNYAYAMLALVSFEALGLQSLLQTVGNYAATSASVAQAPEQPAKCSSYFQTLTPSRFKSIVQNGLASSFPNSALYFLSFVSAYCVQSMLFFSNECSELGPQYSNRPYLAIASASLFLTLYALYLIIYGCDSIMRLTGTLIVGILVGILLCYQNYMLFGKSSVNLLFIPEITQRSGMDYICATVNTSSR
jgi:hypothetical protein